MNYIHVFLDIIKRSNIQSRNQGIKSILLINKRILNTSSFLLIYIISEKPHWIWQPCLFLYRLKHAINFKGGPSDFLRSPLPTNSYKLINSRNTEGKYYYYLFYVSSFNRIIRSPPIWNTLWLELISDWKCSSKTTYRDTISTRIWYTVYRNPKSHLGLMALGIFRGH